MEVVQTWTHQAQKPLTVIDVRFCLRLIASLVIVPRGRRALEVETKPDEPTKPVAFGILFDDPYELEGSALAEVATGVKSSIMSAQAELDKTIMMTALA